MRQLLLLSLFLSIINQIVYAQNINASDTINNLALPTGYTTSELGALPDYQVKGRGHKSLILIPGIGFDGSVYADFMESNRKHYRMFAITIPGYGKTASPPLPPNGTSYGKQVWNNGVVEGIKKLIEKEQLVKPILIANFTQGVQIAMKFAIDYQHLIGGIVLVGGPSKFIAVQNGKVAEYSLDYQIKAIDTYMAPKFYKTIRKEVFDENNYLAELYSIHKELAAELWMEPTKVPLPVMIQYLCEFFASDLTESVNKIKVPILVIRPGFSEELLNQPNIPTLNYIKPQFIDGWEKFKDRNSKLEIVDVANSGVFVWKDQPKEFNRLISNFVKKAK